MCYLNGKEYDEIVKEVFDLYQDYLLTSFPIDVKSLAAKMGIKLIPYSSLLKEDRECLLQNEETKDGFHTCKTDKGYPEFAIWYNDLDQKARWRHTIAHEIGHIILRHGSKASEKQEAAADYFAKQLLAPSYVLNFLGIREIGDIVSNFQISYESAFYTLKAIQNYRDKYGDVFMGCEADFVNWARRWLAS